MQIFSKKVIRGYIDENGKKFVISLKLICYWIAAIFQFVRWLNLFNHPQRKWNKWIAVTILKEIQNRLLSPRWNEEMIEHRQETTT